MFDELVGCIVVIGVVLYLLGILFLMLGENVGLVGGLVFGYLKVFEVYDWWFLGFVYDMYGVEVEDGMYCVYCLMV